jgi:hypothetical protein
MMIGQRMAIDNNDWHASVIDRVVGWIESSQMDRVEESRIVCMHWSLSWLVGSFTFEFMMDAVGCCWLLLLFTTCTRYSLLRST